MLTPNNNREKLKHQFTQIKLMTSLTRQERENYDILQRTIQADPELRESISLNLRTKMAKGLTQSIYEDDNNQQNIFAKLNIDYIFKIALDGNGEPQITNQMYRIHIYIRDIQNDFKLLSRLGLYDKFSYLTKIVIIFRDTLVIQNFAEMQQDLFNFLRPYSKLEDHIDYFNKDYLTEVCFQFQTKEYLNIKSNIVKDNEENVFFNDINITSLGYNLEEQWQKQRILQLLDIYDNNVNRVIVGSKSEFIQQENFSLQLLGQVIREKFGDLNELWIDFKNYTDATDDSIKFFFARLRGSQQQPDRSYLDISLKFGNNQNYLKQDILKKSYLRCLDFQHKDHLSINLERYNYKIVLKDNNLLNGTDLFCQYSKDMELEQLLQDKLLLEQYLENPEQINRTNFLKKQRMYFLKKQIFEKGQKYLERNPLIGRNGLRIGHLDAINYILNDKQRKYTQINLNLNSAYLFDNQDLFECFLKSLKSQLKNQIKISGKGNLQAKINLQFDINNIYNKNCVDAFKVLMKYISYIKNINNQHTNQVSIYNGDLYDLTTKVEWHDVQPNQQQQQQNEQQNNGDNQSDEFSQSSRLTQELGNQNNNNQGNNSPDGLYSGSSFGQELKKQKFLKTKLVVNSYSEQQLSSIKQALEMVMNCSHQLEIKSFASISNLQFYSIQKALKKIDISKLKSFKVNFQNSEQIRGEVIKDMAVLVSSKRDELEKLQIKMNNNKSIKIQEFNPIKRLLTSQKKLRVLNLIFTDVQGYSIEQLNSELSVAGDNMKNLEKIKIINNNIGQVYQVNSGLSSILKNNQQSLKSFKVILGKCSYESINEYRFQQNFSDHFNNNKIQKILFVSLGMGVLYYKNQQMEVVQQEVFMHKFIDMETQQLMAKFLKNLIYYFWQKETLTLNQYAQFQELDDDIKQPIKKYSQYIQGTRYIEDNIQPDLKFFNRDFSLEYTRIYQLTTLVVQEVQYGYHHMCNSGLHHYVENLSDNIRNITIINKYFKFSYKNINTQQEKFIIANYLNKPDLRDYNERAWRDYQIKFRQIVQEFHNHLQYRNCIFTFNLQHCCNVGMQCALHFTQQLQDIPFRQITVKMPGSINFKSYTFFYDFVKAFKYIPIFDYNQFNVNYQLNEEIQFQRIEELINLLNVNRDKHIIQRQQFILLKQKFQQYFRLDIIKEIFILQSE